MYSTVTVSTLSFEPICQIQEIHGDILQYKWSQGVAFRRFLSRNYTKTFSSLPGNLPGAAAPGTIIQIIEHSRAAKGLVSLDIQCSKKSI